MSTVIYASFGALLDAPYTTHSRSFDKRRVFVPLAIVAVLLALWASLAPISGAVIAARAHQGGA